MGILQKIILVFSLTVFLFVLAGIFVFQQEKNILRNELYIDIQNSTRLKAESIKLFFDKNKQIMDFLSSGVLTARFFDINSDSFYDKVLFQKRFYDIVTNNPNVLRILILDKNGDFVVSSDNSVNFDREIFNKVKKNQRYVISGVKIKPGSNYSFFSYLSPITKDNRFLGWALIDFSLKELDDILGLKANLKDAQTIYLLDENYHLISPLSLLDKKGKENLKTQNAIDCFSHKKSGHGSRACTNSYKDKNGFNILASHYYIPETGWCLINKINEADVFAPLDYLKKIIFLIVILLFILLLIVSAFFANSIVGPIRQLIQGAKEFANGNFSYKIKIKNGGNDELQLLKNAFNEAGSQLKKAELAKKRYNEKLKNEVKKKTAQLKMVLEKIQKDKHKLEEQRLAMLNILEDVNESQKKLKKSNQSLEKRKKELEALRFLSDELTGVLSIKEAVAVLSKYLEGFLNYSVATFLIINPNNLNDFVWVAKLRDAVTRKFLNKNKEELIKFLSFKLKDKNFSDYSFLKKAKINILGLRPETGDKIKKASTFIMPLTVGNNIFGAVHIASFRRGFTKKREGEEFIKAVIATFAVVVSRLQMLDRAQKSISESLVRSLRDGVLMFDNNKKIVFINDVARDIFGKKEKIDNLNSLKAVFAKIKMDKISRSVLTKGEILRENDLKINSSYYEMLIVPVRDYQNKIVGGALVLHDITKMKEIAQMKTEFVSVASHQLRTPLTAIKLFTEMLYNGEVGKLSKAQKEYLDNVYQSVERMVRLVNDLLNISRLESGRLSVVPEPTDLPQFIQAIIDEVKPMADLKKCQIIFQKPKKKLPKIPLDPNLMRQVVHNLVVNAIKYSGEKNPKIVVSLKDYDKNNILISVKDNGMGIPKEMQKRIFQKFFRADNAVKAVTEGTGLGLYVSKMITESSGGKIWFESQENKGSEFFVILPKKGMKRKKGDKTLAG